MRGKDGEGAAYPKGIALRLLSPPSRGLSGTSGATVPSRAERGWKTRRATRRRAPRWGSRAARRCAAQPQSRWLQACRRAGAGDSRRAAADPGGRPASHPATKRRLDRPTPSQSGVSARRRGSTLSSSRARALARPSNRAARSSCARATARGSNAGRAQRDRPAPAPRQRRMPLLAVTDSRVHKRAR